MSFDAVSAWARERTLPEWLGLGAALAVFGYVGWDGALWDARYQLLLHLFAVASVAAVAVLALRGLPLPVTRIDVPLLGLLAAFAVATASAMNHGMSLRAFATIAATGAMLPLAMIAIRHRRSWVGFVVAAPVLVISIPTLVALLARRVEWIVVGAPGLPPLRLASEGTPFGSVAVPPFVIWPAFVAAGLIEPTPLRRTIRIGLVSVGIPLTILSGSRSAWLAIAVTAFVALVPWAWRRRGAIGALRRPGPRSLLMGAIGLIALAGVAVLVIPRALSVTSLVYRASLWRDTLNAWRTDPLFGIGPGFMPYARQAAAPDFTFPVHQPHSHNLPLGVLGDAGLVGLVAAAALVVAVAWVAGPWRARTPTGREAGLVLIALGFGGLFEDLTFLPGFNLIAIAVVAIALTDAGAVRWTPLPGGRRLAALGVGGAVMAATLGAAMVVADAGAVAYRMGIDAAASGEWAGATRHLERSVAIDQWQPSGFKALAVAADRDGQTRLARRAAERATALNPGDSPSWINLALLCQALGDRDCQYHATERSVATAEFFEAELVNAAFSYEAMGRQSEADDAYRRSLLSQRLTALTSDWPRHVPIGDATLDDDFGALLEFNRLLAWWDMGEPIRPESISDPATRALAHAMVGDRPSAERWLKIALDGGRAEIVPWDLAVILRDHWGEDVEREIAIAGAVRGRDFPAPDAEQREPRLTYDIGAFRAFPGDGLVAAARRLRTDPTYPWALEATLP
jgi:O-antigen ligase/tetratricopeptide (TPR) repeat protein